jgi:hypothetical protein
MTRLSALPAFTLTFALAATALPPAAAHDLGDRSATQWSPCLEWTLQNPNWSGDPFDVLATAEFRHTASGEILRTPLFHQGGTTWAFRFSATRPGSWSFTTTSDETDLHGHTGTVTVTPPTPQTPTHGFLGSINGKWAWLGTRQVFTPQLVMWDYIAVHRNPADLLAHPEQIDRAIDEFIHQHGFDGFHFPVVGGRWFDLEAGDDKVTAGMTRPDPRTFQALELLITKTHAAGGMVHLWPWGDHQRSQTPKTLAGGLGGHIDQRWQRYLAARLGPIPGWSMGFGFDLDEWITADQLRQWHHSMHQLMGWSHPLGGRPEGPNHGTDHTSNAAWNAGLDYSSYEHHRPTYDVYLAAINALPGRPVMSEDRFRIRESPYPEKDYTPERVRRGLYHSIMAGGVANIWGIDPALSPGGTFPNREQIKTCTTFFREKNRFLADMAAAPQPPHPTPTRVLLSPAAASAVAYQESTQTIQFTLDPLPAGLPIIAVDTRQAYQEIALGHSAAGLQTLQLPHTSDWVLAIGRFKNTPIAARPAQAASPLAFTALPQPPIPPGAHGAQWADVDDDGLPDLYLPLIHSGLLPDLFFHNQGTGTFSEQGRQRGIDDPDGGSHGAAWCDLDHDGDYDLINGSTAHGDAGATNNIFRNDGKGRFTKIIDPALETRAEATRAFLAFDMDRDGDLDLFAVTGYLGTGDPEGERNEVYLHESAFTFTAVNAGDLASAPAGQGATDTDFDGDGDIDILAANRTGPLNVLQNDGRGHFTRIDPASIGFNHRAEDGVTTADVDRDGDLDVLLAGSGGQAHLHLNQGDGTFRHHQSFAPTAGYMGGFADLDHDGHLDLYFAGDRHVLLNDGTGHFAPGPAVPIEAGRDPRGVAFADLDGDGDLDFAVGDKRTTSLFLIRNDLQTAAGQGHWLKIRLTSPLGQAGAFGAKTFIHPAGQKNGRLLGLRESRSNTGYLAQDDPILHFGLGPHTAVDVVVVFADGTTTTRTGIAANQTVTLPGT